MDVEKRLKPNNGIPMAYDLASHHALGGGSYVFKRDYPVIPEVFVVTSTQKD
jgi:hypothetical protein